MAKLKPNLAEINEFAPAKMLQNYVTPDVKTVEISTLRPHPHNKKYFRTESADYFERLREDVQKRGIVVPLIAKKDGVLLAGHNRLEVAKQLGLKYVPVQYVHRDLSDDQEQEFLIKDNLLRRQFTGDEWIDIYRRLYPNFEEAVIHERLKGRAKGGIKTLTAKNIADDTGQKVSAVQKQLQKFRHSHTTIGVANNTKKGGTIPPFADDVSQSSKQALSNTAIIKISRKKCISLLKECAKRVESIEDETVLIVYKKAQALMKAIETRELKE